MVAISLAIGLLELCDLRLGFSVFHSLLAPFYVLPEGFAKRLLGYLALFRKVRLARKTYCISNRTSEGCIKSHASNCCASHCYNANSF